MNQKTAKTLRRTASEYAKEKGMNPRWAYQELKKLWKWTPRDLKHTLGI